MFPTVDTFKASFHSHAKKFEKSAATDFIKNLFYLFFHEHVCNIIYEILSRPILKF